MLAPLAPTCRVVQFDSLPSPKDLARLSDLMARHPSVPLRAYGGYDGTIDNLEFLEHFPTLTRFHADALRYHDFKSIEGLRFLPDGLEELGLGLVKRRLSLKLLSRFTGLRTLYIEGNNWKDIDVIAGLTAIEELTLRSVTLPDLSILLPLRHLRSLDLKLGGTRDLSLLPQLAPLRFLELWMIRGLDTLEPVGESASLQFLFLQDLAQIAKLPDMSRMTSLRRIHIQNLKALDDLSPLLSAPALEELVVFESRNLKPEHFECLTQHPTLTHAVVALGSRRKNDAVKSLLPLPLPPGTFAFR